MVLSYQPAADNDAHDLDQLRATIADLEEKNQQLSGQVNQLIFTEHKLYASQAQLDSQVRLYRKLYELGKSLNKTFDLSEVLAFAAEFVIYQLEFERCLLLLFNPLKNTFDVEVFDGYYDAAATAQARSLSLSADAPLGQRLIHHQDYEICLEVCEDDKLCEWRSLLGMDEYIVFALRQEAEAPLGLLIAGNTAERFAYHTRVRRDEEGFLGLANAASQITTAINSVNFYQALNEERSLLENRVQARTEDLNQKNESLQSTLKELQLTQAQLVHSEKMSGLGHLVAGIAHEINNPVNFIFGNLIHAGEYTQDLLSLIETYQLYERNPHPAVQEKLEEIEIEFLIEDLPSLIASMKMGANRIKDIVLSLRTFSRMDEADMKTVNIHQGIDSTLMILDHKLRRNGKSFIKVTKRYSDLPAVECYAGQLNQVFINILSNAIDALDERREQSSKDSSEDSLLGEINITTTAHEGHVLIVIADNGPGIPASVRKNIFDPFFTTKPVGKGNGLGLSISYQIVCDRHGGSLECDSAEGQGTRFLIKIPTNLAH